MKSKVGVQGDCDGNSRAVAPHEVKAGGLGFVVVQTVHYRLRPRDPPGHLRELEMDRGVGNDKEVVGDSNVVHEGESRNSVGLLRALLRELPLLLLGLAGAAGAGRAALGVFKLPESDWRLPRDGVAKVGEADQGVRGGVQAGVRRKGVCDARADVAIKRHLPLGLQAEGVKLVRPPPLPQRVQGPLVPHDGRVGDVLEREPAVPPWEGVAKGAGEERLLGSLLRLRLLRPDPPVPHNSSAAVRVDGDSENHAVTIKRVPKPVPVSVLEPAVPVAVVGAEQLLGYGAPFKRLLVGGILPGGRIEAPQEGLLVVAAVASIKPVILLGLRGRPIFHHRRRAQAPEEDTAPSSAPRERSVGADSRGGLV
mmetsp:Transcript_27021/g.68555  ORF Transcript_27021/g.68555 Transcript_27021/m.68555 type:complete len:366 (-) Transcript_27021:214-1311(-)